MIIIPAIDIIDGKCVRLTQGDYAQKTVYNDNPVEVAKSFQDAGFTRLHLVDLDGAKAGAVQNWRVLESIATATELVIDFGGGVKQRSDVEVVLNSGAKMVTIGSIAVKRPDTVQQWLLDFGAEQFFLGADVRGEHIAIGGWLETSQVNVYDFIEGYRLQGLNQVFCTDVSRDGKLEGPSIELYKDILRRFPNLSFVASGGVSNLQDVEALKAIGCAGVIIGKAIYEGRITLEELQSLSA